MTLQIPDEIRKVAGLDESGLLLELASRLFDTQRLTLIQAARLAGIKRGEFEDALHDRAIPIYRYDEQDFRDDLDAIGRRGGRGQ
jgi:predicted HTH domain antitoxin